MTNLTENIEKYKRHSSSLISKNNATGAEFGEDELDEDEEESVNPFLVKKQNHKTNAKNYKDDDEDEDESNASVEEESDDESIFDKLRDEVQHQLYNE